MTRDEAIQVLRDWDGCFIGHRSDDVNEALNMAIKALGQEPILDKIRAEIQGLRNCSCGCSDGIIDDVEDILDKYTAESAHDVAQEIVKNNGVVEL